MDKKDKALETFTLGFNCSQSVFSTFAEDLGIDRDIAMKVSCGFGGGMGKLQETCGAVSGAFMAIGLKYGNTTVDKEVKEFTYSKVKEFAERFKKIHGTLKCRELLNVDLNTEEGHDFYKENCLHEKVCEKCVQDAVKILDEIL